MKLTASRYRIKDFLPRSMMGRTSVIIIVLAVLLQVALAFLFYETHWRKVSDRILRVFVQEVAYVITQIEKKEATMHAQILREASQNFGIGLTFEAGRVLNPVMYEAQTRRESILLEAFSVLNRSLFIDAYTIDGGRTILIRLQLEQGVLNVRFLRKRLFSLTVYAFILWMMSISLILFAVTMIIMKNQIRPIQHLAKQADNLGKGLPVRPLKPEGALEVRQAIQAFHAMQERIERHMNQRTEMLSGISHDLRTPLTRMKLQLTMLEQKNAATEGLMEDIDDMQHMLNGYLDFVRGDQDEEPTPIVLQPFLSRLIARVEPVENVGRSPVIILHMEKEIVVKARENALRRAIHNVLHNALHYATRVCVTGWSSAGSVHLCIEDNGPGVAPEYRTQVLKPFVRLDASRNTATGGIGLGLSIARDIIQAHGGDIAFEDPTMDWKENPDNASQDDAKGARVHITLPL